MSRSVTWLLRTMRNAVKKFYWHHTHNHIASIQHFPVLRLYSVMMQPASLKKETMFRVV